jgi:threonine/homoserine/homoserine lactone efflux protein
MPDSAHWSAFLTATIILLLVPGPSVLFVVARKIEQGFRAALFSSAGLAPGDLFQVLCAAVGLSTVLASSLTLFTIVKYGGATYLISLVSSEFSKGMLPRFRTRPATKLAKERRAPWFFRASPSTLSTPRRRCSCWRGCRNSSVRAAERCGFRFFVLGGAFVALAFVTNSIYGRVGGELGSFAKRSVRFRTAARYGAGGHAGRFGCRPGPRPYLWRPHPRSPLPSCGCVPVVTGIPLTPPRLRSNLQARRREFQQGVRPWPSQQ